MVLTFTIPAVTLSAAATLPSSAGPPGFAGSHLDADLLIEQSLPNPGTANTQNSTKFPSVPRRHERVTTELFGIWLTAIFVGLLILNAISF